jgi:hypothetical protein
MLLNTEFLHRSYCLDELLFHENAIHKKYNLGSVIAHHKCGHKYRTKRGGRKELAMMQTTGKLPIKTCSVCFKLKNNRIGFLNKNVINLIGEKEGSKNFDFNFLKQKILFYNWLYYHI